MLIQINENYRRDLNKKRFEEIGYFHKDLMYLLVELEEAYYNITKKYIPFSDMYRSPYKSYLAKIKKGTKAASPGNSGHNWGISIDIDINKMCEELNFSKNYNKKIKQLREWMAEHKFYYILRKKNPETGKRICEDWHYNACLDEHKDVIENKAGESRKILLKLYPELYSMTDLDKQITYNIIAKKYFSARKMKNIGLLKEDGKFGLMSKLKLKQMMIYFKCLSSKDETQIRFLKSFVLL
jgi:hypothetical protein